MWTDLRPGLLSAYLDLGICGERTAYADQEACRYTRTGRQKGSAIHSARSYHIGQIRKDQTLFRTPASSDGFDAGAL
jgi:hypothetical protein